MFLSEKRVLVTGACGTVGKELIRQLLEAQYVGEIVELDNNESALFFLEQHFAEYPHASFFLADVLKRAGKINEARACFKKTLGLNPHNIEAARELRFMELRERQRESEKGGFLKRLFKS